MASAPGLRVRHSIADIQADYDGGNKKELDDLMRKWKDIKELGPNEFNSFFTISGLHGAPFRGPGTQTDVHVGGRLLPAWHRSKLGYTYRPGSLDGHVRADAPQSVALAPTDSGEKTVHVTGTDRSQICGSFLIATWADLDGKKQLIGIEPMFGRRQVVGCANCQTELKVSADLPLPPTADSGSVALETHTRDGLFRNGLSRGRARSMSIALATAASGQPFTVEIR